MPSALVVILISPFGPRSILVPLNMIGLQGVRQSRCLVRMFASLIAFSSLVAKMSLARINVSSVCIPTIPNSDKLVLYSRHGSYVDSVIPSLFR